LKDSVQISHELYLQEKQFVQQNENSHRFHTNDTKVESFLNIQLKPIVKDIKEDAQQAEFNVLQVKR